MSYCSSEEFVITACEAVLFSFHCFIELASLLLELFLSVFKGFGTLLEGVRSTHSGELIQLVALLAPFPIDWTIVPFFMSSCSSTVSTRLWSWVGVFPLWGLLALWNFSCLCRGCCLTLATFLAPSEDLMSRICSDVSSI